MKKKHIYPYIFLTCLVLVMIVVIIPPQNIFGSNTDWLSQHVNIADSLRKLILDSNSIFPDFVFNLGAGQNIYNFSYYGLLRPDILISCLIPFVEMKDVIVAYMIFNLVVSTNLTYYWLKQKQFNYLLCIVGAIMLLSSSVLFQSHRQIMFVNYMPGLLLGLIAVDRYLDTNKNKLLIGAIVWIIINSYFFSVTAIFVIFSYYCFEVINKDDFKIKRILRIFKPIIIAILICSVLLLPTAYVMLENQQTKTEAINLMNLFIPDLNLNALLYDPYGCGLSYLSLIGLVLGLTLKKTRKLTIFLLLILFMPIFKFCLNGFLYPRNKILIPFIPIIIYVLVDVLNEYKQINKKINIFLLILFILPAVVVINKPLIVLDIVVCLIGIIIYLKWDYQTLLLLMIMPLLIGYTTNQQESYVTKKTYNQVNKLSNVKVENNYRYDSFKQSLNTVNQGNNTYRTSIYSSINNNLYNHFYYDVIKNPISIRNRVACISNSNIFFQGLLGVKTVYSEDVVPIGYNQIDKNLYENNNVLPLVYATSDSYAEKQFNELQFPATLDTIYNNVIVENGHKDYQSKIKNIDLNTSINYQSNNLKITKIDNGYQIDTKNNSKLELNLNTILENKILIIEFDIKDVKYIEKLDTTIKINGIKNKLSSINAAYPNNNTHFTYIISQNEPLDKLQLEFSQGHYNLKNIKTYIIDYDVIKNRHNNVDALRGVYNQDGFVARGEIDVSKDGYLVTSFPYQKGFSVLIDGKEVESECVNTAFLGTKISKGKHDVEIVFNAPMKNIGLCLSFGGLVLFVVQGRKKDEERFKRVD
ncbi:YfhO family protein [Thomasclavelia sp.]|uniref:YfhO family protein n=1 Tax=Thomasclavelia sp. TaxID=3025757 RepID=UPI0026115873|nr:YfhO family protein [Thomasclavelia sp.]